MTTGQLSRYKTGQIMNSQHEKHKTLAHLNENGYH